MRPRVVRILILLAAMSAPATLGVAEIRLDLAVNEADLAIRGPERFDYLGASIATGDWNGDGLLDLAVGAFLTDGPDATRADAGLVMIRFGAGPGGGSLEGQAVVRIHGAHAGDLAGFALAAGDLNGDGIADLALSAPGMDGPDGSRTDCGAVYVFFGRDHRIGRFPAVIDLASTAADVTLHGVDPLDTLGGPYLFEPIAFGQLDGDPFADLVVGFPGGDGPDGLRESAGEIHVFFGSASPPAVVDLAASSPLAVFGADEGDLLGAALATGDLNGDGVGDLVGGAKNAGGALNLFDKTGEAVGIFGRAMFPPTIDLASGPDAWDFIVYGVDPLDRSARALATGDLDGDGIHDLVIGARHADGSSNQPAQESAGETYVILGHPLLSGEYFLAYDSALTLYGAEKNDSIGFSVGVGDVNGDGYGDLISAAQYSDGEANLRVKSGEVVVILGGPTLPPVVDLLVDAPDIRVFGERMQDALGTMVAAADWDGDGLDDLLLGGPGRVYKQLTVPPPNADLESIVDGGGIWVLRGAPVLGRLGRSSESVTAGSSFRLDMELANLMAEGRTARIHVRWIDPAGPDPGGILLKTKDIELGVRQAIVRSRLYPVAPGTPEGTYYLDLTVESPPGAPVDHDRIAILVKSP